MRQIIFNLEKKMQRPIVALHNFPGLSALLDTGAYFPIWTDDEEILISMLDAKLIMKNVTFGGFGGQAYGNLYKMYFELGDLIFPNMYIIACKDLVVPFHMILSATMFRDLIYEIDDKSHLLKITIPDGEHVVRRLKIADNKGVLHVFCNSERKVS